MSAAPRPRLGTLWGAAWESVPAAISRHLAAGGSALEIGCGSGLACLALAEAIPAARIVGHDPDRAAVERARDLARLAGLDARVSFAASDSTRLPRAAFHLILAEGLGERAAEPLRVLNAVRNALHPDGACLLLEPARLPRAPPDLETLARAAGFSRIRLLTTGPARLCELRR